jgi:hypothetical protein
MIDADGAGDRPVNRTLHVHGRGRTPGLERVLTDFGMDDSFDRASKKVLEHYGLKVGRTSLLRVVERQGERAERHIRVVLDCAQLEAEFSSPAHPLAEVLVEMDGSEARTGNLVAIEGTTEKTPVRRLPRRRRITAWRDVRVGLVRPLDADKASYVASLASFDDVVSDLGALALLRGADKDTTHVKVVDGGNGLREALDRRLAGPTILDKPHCRSHLFETAAEMGVSGKDGRAMVERWTTTASRGRVQDVIVELEGWRPANWTP